MSETGLLAPQLRREQIYSNLIGQHVAVGTWLTSERLLNYAQLVKGRSIGQVDANARATALLADAVQKQAYVLAFIDGFMVLGFAVIGVLSLMLLLRTPPAQGGPTAEQSISKLLYPRCSPVHAGSGERRHRWGGETPLGNRSARPCLVAAPRQ
jgi:hypothetical protein